MVNNNNMVNDYNKDMLKSSIVVVTVTKYSIYDLRLTQTYRNKFQPSLAIIFFYNIYNIVLPYSCGTHLNMLL